MIAYHGTAVTGLDVLKPFANPLSNLDYPCVYLSTYKPLASIYIWNRSFKWMTYGFNADGIPVYSEYFKGCLLEFYGDVKGCIYECDDDFDTDRDRAVKHSVVSIAPVSVKCAEPVENAYERILQHEKHGELIINRYETLSGEQKQKIEGIIFNEIKQKELLKGNHPLSGFVAEKFPELWAAAAEL